MFCWKIYPNLCPSLPKENKKDLFDLPEEVSTQLNFLFVKHIDEVLEATLLND